MVYEIYSRANESHNVDKSYGYYESLVELIADFILLQREVIYAKVVVGTDEFNEFGENINQAFDTYVL